jgi:beta-glucosidase
MVIVLVFATFALQAVGQELFRDPAAPMDARVHDLISRLTLDEKANLMKNESPGVPRLGLAPYDWWNEALHGVARAGHATVFPQAIGLAAMWDVQEMQRVADVISTEGRAIYNDAIAHDANTRYHGITFWSPNINIFRDPRWGRGQETYGEDPFLTAQTAIAFVRGMQGEAGSDGRYLKTAACAKHLAVHSGPESTRYTANVEPDAADLNETYLPAFEAVVREGHVEAVMTAYNSIYGVPCSISPLLYSRLRDWNFDGHVVSDCGAVYILFEKYGVAHDFAEAEAMAVKAGLCLRCGDGPATLADAVRRGLLTEAQLDESLFRLMRTWFRLGMFDPADTVPYSKITIAANDTPENGAVALEAARKALVLLKNDGVLPLQRESLHRVLVVGPNADSVPALLGNYNGTPSAPVTILAGLRAALARGVAVDSALGCDYAAVHAGFVAIPRTALSLTDPLPSDEGDDSGLRSEVYSDSGFTGVPAQVGRAHEIEINLKDDTTLAPGVTAKKYSARYRGVLTTSVAGDYEFSISATGGVRLLVGDEVVIDGMKPGEKSVKATRRLGERASLPLRLEYVHDTKADGGPAKLNLQWNPPPADAGFDAALAKARLADAVIFVGGISAELEGEDMRVDFEGFAGGDRTRIELPEIQQRLIRALAKTKKPLVVVNLSGSAMAFGEANDEANAIVQAWYPGQAGGTAVADVLLGKVNPSGRLPVTFYRATADLPDFADYRMTGRTYRYFRGAALYPFGHGLSYTHFSYANLRASVHGDDGVDLTVDVTNDGKRDGEEVVQAYLREPASAHPRAVRSLAGCARVSLAAGEKKTVRLGVPQKWLRRWNAEKNNLAIPSGEWGVDIGASSADVRASGTVLVP